MKLVLLVAGCGFVSAQVAVNGGWSEWTDSGICCGGFIKRVRACDSPVPSGGGTFCAGPSELPFTCDIDECGGNGWSDWVESTACCYGVTTRSRTCLAVIADYCVGNATESEACTRMDGLSDCYAANTATGSCEIPFSPEGQVLFETMEQCCSTQFPAAVGVCMGDDSATLAPSPSASVEGSLGSSVEGSGDGGVVSGEVVNGGWGEWTEYNTCCDNTQSRFRVCDNPKPSENGEPCEGSFREERPCSPNACGVDGEGGGSTSSSNADRLVAQSTSAILAALTAALL